MLNSLILLTSLILFAAGRVDSATVSMLKFGATLLDMETIGTTKSVSSVVSCGVYCRQYFKNCYIFIYNQVTQLCTPGTKPMTLSRPSNLTDGLYYYTPGTYCRTGFTLTTYDGVSACIWVSTVTADYLTAKNSCKAKGAYLYTIKVVQKLNLLIDLFKPSSPEYWIGLEDMVDVGVWRWADDNSVLNISFTLFSPNNPDFLNTERCVLFGWIFFPINNYLCTAKRYYICEMKPLVIS